VTSRELYHFRRRNGQCVKCGLVAIKGRVCCRRCQQRRARAYRRNRTVRRAARRASDQARYKRLRATSDGRHQITAASRRARVRRKQREVCVDCRRPPAPDRVRCPRHLRRARDRQKARRRRQP
jgi:hypothetical protein